MGWTACWTRSAWHVPGTARQSHVVPNTARHPGSDRVQAEVARAANMVQTVQTKPCLARVKHRLTR